MKLLKSKEAAEKLRVCLDTFRKEVKHQPDFPKAIKLTPRSHPMWDDAEIDNYLHRKAA